MNGSPAARAAVDWAVAEARSRSLRLRVVHACEQERQEHAMGCCASSLAFAGDGVLMDLYQEDTRAVADGVDRWRAENPDVEITHAAWVGHPVSVLTEAAASADLVVVGSRGLGGFAAAIMGSVGHGVLHHVTCPVAPRARTA